MPMPLPSSRCVGDLIFVRPSADDWAGRLVADKTNGPYCHCRIRVNLFGVVEALASGITHSTLAHEPEPADVAMVGHTLNEQRLTGALDWLNEQVGHAYGVLDIAADALQVLLPPWLGSRTPFLVAPSTYNCSHLAATFLVSAGYALPPAMIADLPRTSPNSLARALGVIK